MGKTNIILVIDDDDSIRSIVAAFLRAADYTAIEAANGAIGVDLAKQHRPDLIVCDVQMPELDGYSVLTELRKIPETATIPFIFLTGKGEMSDLRQGMGLGADDYLTKPFKRTDLLKAVGTRLAKQEAIQQRFNQELKQAEEKLNHFMRYDSLTNLPNRLMLRERISDVLRSEDKLIGVLSVGLDRFSRINDTLGHSAGDELLKTTAERLLTCVGNHDTVARLHADQFAVILASVDHQHEISELAQNMLEILSRACILDKHEVFTSASIGIALYPGHADNIDQLIKNADAAMHYAKKRGGNTFQFFETEIQMPSSDDLILEASLRHALEREEFEMYYQPQVDLLSGKIVGAEGLIRWHHPERGLVSPGRFIHLAEENGLIVPIGQWALSVACKQALQWQETGYSEFRVSVNLSGTQFNQPNLIDRLVRILGKTELDPKYLDIEITESILMQNTQQAISTLTGMKALGLQISIDDFGTGYSSLSYLKQFPFDILKIDQSFIRNVTVDSKNAAITMAIIQMAHNLNLKVIAEGVETEGELQFLSMHQCNELQGYLFSPPVPAPKFEEFLSTDKRLQFQQ